jgi:AhpD family alkylhydroperoxidase
MKFDDFAAGKLLDHSHAADHLTEREKQLIGLAVALTRGCVHCSGGRMRRALESGISQDAVIQAIDIAAAVNAGVTTAIAMQAFEKEEQSPMVDFKGKNAPRREE